MASDLQAQRAQILKEIERRGGRAKAPGFAKQLDDLDNQIKQAKPTPAPTPASGNQAFTGGSPNFNEKTGQMNPVKPAPAPVGQVGANFKMGDTDARLQEQLLRANSEITRRGGTAPNNQARKSALEAEIAKRRTAQPPVAQPPAQNPTFAEPIVPNKGPTQGAQPPAQQPPTNSIQPAPPGGPAGQNPNGLYNPSNPSIPTGSGNDVGIPEGPGQGGSGSMTPDQMFGNIYGQATGGTLNQFDTAANRLRERLDASSEAALDQAKSRNVGRGFGDSGLQDQAAYNINQGSQNAYAQGLNDLSTQFEQQRQQGLGIGLGAANAASQGQQQRNALGQLDFSQLRGINADLLNNREGRGSAERMSQNQLAQQLAMQQGQFGFQGGQNDLDRGLQERLAQQGFQFQGGENSANRDLQKLLGQLQEQGSNWRSSLNQLMGLPGGTGGSGMGGLGGLFGGGGGASYSSPSGSGMANPNVPGYDLGSTLMRPAAR